MKDNPRLTEMQQHFPKKQQLWNFVVLLQQGLRTLTKPPPSIKATDVATLPIETKLTAEHLGDLSYPTQFTEGA